MAPVSRMPAWRFHTGTLGYESAGVVTLFVSDFDAHPDGAVAVHEDSLERPRDDIDDPAHAVADARTLGNSSRKRLAAHLKQRVMSRDPVFSYHPAK